MPTLTNHPVPTIGIGCRFPGGLEDPRSVREMGAEGTDAIGETPPNRSHANAYSDTGPETPGCMIVGQSGFLRTPLDSFDAGFWLFCASIEFSYA